MEIKSKEHWVVKIQMLPGDELKSYIIYIFRVEKNGDIGFFIIGDDYEYWRSQVEWFEPVRKIDLEEKEYERF